MSRPTSRAAPALIEIVRAGVLTSVQDLGRTGYRRFGVCMSGALDPLSLYVGNRLVGNRSDAAGIEFTLGHATLRFLADGLVALTGADCLATLDGAPVHAWHAFPVQRGQTLTLRVAQGGVRAYLCVAGGIDVPEMMGSRATDLKAGFGGFEGRPLRDGDRLAALPADRSHAPDVSGAAIGVKAPRWTFDRMRGELPVMRVLPGPEYDDFLADSQAAFWESEWTLTPNSNRMGFRLQGPELVRRQLCSGDLLSHGVVPGVIQVPPSGQPIVLMADAQTTGGYPKIGTVILADQWRLAQVPLGTRIRFARATLEEAEAARADVSRYLQQIETALDWQRRGILSVARRTARTRPMA
ncbi:MULTISPECIES: biotin-dependent carboxyltransferase family protein [Ralstonia solanacearum species complex]|uniref:Allophanate hydrolase n=3 Tax=Ralstonia solanacearum species complex TaxID=3116862 RepID=E5RQ41_RALSL|nr:MULTISPECIES: biotin-dependent carboxyltransferase family protein [Ralstonia]APC68998.1 allophanate hydrolase [Ralstonia solanacearum OE1-1]AUS41942.1 allophanate hydrolase [Ralstonia solanacearum]AGH84641.1 Allophanate hydrolase 2 subunit 2 [Ralstonia pseudosolanacearum FQY_4]API74277.1 allophanate hydrolase [Ralstonia pseudosolanacearum]AST27708.1 allophanate hydrolase [Ralstonia pseudosolanacearum]